MIRMLAITVGLLALTIGLAPAVVRADGSWLDGPPTNWNTPGMAIPPAPAPQPVANPSCTEEGNPPGSPEEQALVNAGWMVRGRYVSVGENIRIVHARSQNFDGMCRPMGYQSFVFVDGQPAGTLSPEPMNSRTDGAMSGTRVFVGAQPIWGEYARYTPQDPLCCPSRISRVTFEIDRTGAAPLVVPTSVTTEATSAQPGPSPAPSPPTSAPQPPAQSDPPSSPRPVPAPVQVPRSP